MSCITLDGKTRAQVIQAEISERVKKLVPILGRPPKLAVVLVGQNPASLVYVKSKSKQTRLCGMEAVDYSLPDSISNSELHEELSKLSKDHKLDGILLQLPLPKSLDEFSALTQISEDLDVDGLHPYNQGLLARGECGFRPCTPLGVMDLIACAMTRISGKADIAGLNAVVVGRSALVGKPTAIMLIEQNCTTTICHSKTQNLRDYTVKADILVAAVGKPNLLDATYVKQGAIVIDVGINRLPDGRLCGDVHFESVVQKAAALTPVPGGVGPMTITMLLKNTLESAEKKVSKVVNLC